MDDIEEGRRQAAWRRYAVTLPALREALKDVYPRDDYLEWLGITPQDLITMQPEGHPSDVPPAFSIEHEKKLAAAYIRFRETSRKKLAEVPLVQARKRKEAELEAGERRIQQMETRIEELEEEVAALKKSPILGEAGARSGSPSRAAR